MNDSALAQLPSREMMTFIACLVKEEMCEVTKVEPEVKEEMCEVTEVKPKVKEEMCEITEVEPKVTGVIEKVTEKSVEESISFIWIRLLT